MTNRGDQPASPFMWDQSYNPQFGVETGMTIREKIAAQVISGMLAYNYRKDIMGWDELVFDAVFVADKLIAELSKPTEK